MGKRRRTQDNPSTSNQVTRNVSSDQEFLQQKVGIANLGRNFFFDQIHNTPQLQFNLRYNAFPWGWSDTEGPSSQDQSACVNMETPVTNTLYPITPAAQAFNEEHWPLLYSLLMSGLGTRYTTTMPEVVRYYSSVMTLIENISFVYALNYLTTTFDWRDVAPHSSVVPPAIWDLATMFDATDIGIQETWAPLMARISTKVLPPNYVASLLDNAMPFISNPYGHVVNCNYSGTARSCLLAWDKAGLYTSIWERLKYIESSLATTHNVLASFLPYRVGPMFMAFRGYNSLYEETAYNTAVSTPAFFGDTGDPDNTNCLVVGSEAANGNSLTLFHRGSGLTAQSVAEQSIWDLIYDTIDDTFILLTMYLSGAKLMIDDDLNTVEFDGSAISSDEKRRYIRYCHNRFQDEDGTPLAEGKGAVGFSAAIVPREEIIRIVKRHTNVLFGSADLKKVLELTGGSSVRAIRREISELWSS
jgi:hypothetical protein